MVWLRTESIHVTTRRTSRDLIAGYKRISSYYSGTAGSRPVIACSDLIVRLRKLIAERLLPARLAAAAGAAGFSPGYNKQRAT